MHNKRRCLLKSKHGFTLIEVLISVMIISVVIMALLEMFANNTHIYSSYVKKTKTNQYTSFFISNPEYGFEKDSVYMDELVKDFKIEDDLRRTLKEIKVELDYQIVDTIDISDFEPEEDTQDTQENSEYMDQDIEQQVSSAMAFEIGRSVLKMNDKATKEVYINSLLRFSIQ